MRKRNLTGLLFAAAFVMAGTQFGSVEAQARPHHGEDWEDRWEDRWDDDDNDDEDRWTMTMTTMIAGMMTVGTMTMMTIVGKADTVMEMGIMEVVITASTVRQQAEQ